MAADGRAPQGMEGEGYHTEPGNLGYRSVCQGDDIRGGTSEAKGQPWRYSGGIRRPAAGGRREASPDQEGGTRGERGIEGLEAGEESLSAGA